MAASRRTVFTRDKKRSSPARKKTHKSMLAEQQQQADVLARLWQRAKDEHKASQAA